MPCPTIRVIPLLAAAMLGLAGCYSGQSITQKPSMADAVRPRAAPNGQRWPAYISGMTAKNSSLQAGFENRLIARLNDTGLFSDVIYGNYGRRPDADHVDVRLGVAESVDAHTAGNAAKGFFIGATLYLLAPALPLTYDYQSDWTLDVTWPGNRRRTYTARCGASAYGTLFEEQAAANSVTGEAVDQCLNSLINQMAADYPRGG